VTQSLAKRRVLITGVSRGIGFETARSFLAEGAEIVGTGKDSARLDAARRALDPEGARLTVVAGDVTEPSAIERIVTAVRERWGALDVLFGNAGVQVDGGARGFTDGTEAAFQESLAVNLVAPYRLSMALLPLLRAGTEPRIVHVSSGAGNLESMRATGIASYRLSKFALNGFVMLLATELAGEIAVNAFDPGWVKTDLGGERAPGHPSESARGALALVLAPFSETGKFWKDGREIPF
jgi:NAD(P)-dependent dehydrogenase (short-subunit alcohol dehydrogenase family)